MALEIGFALPRDTTLRGTPLTLTCMQHLDIAGHALPRGARFPPRGNDTVETLHSSPEPLPLRPHPRGSSFALAAPGCSFALAALGISLALADPLVEAVSHSPLVAPA